MVNGNSVLFEIGKESTYGTSAVPTKRLEVSSEGFKYVANKTEEGLLTGRIGGGLVETMSKKTEGSFSTLAKPTSVGYALKGIFGKEVFSEGTTDPIVNLVGHTLKDATGDTYVFSENTFVMTWNKGKNTSNFTYTNTDNTHLVLQSNDFGKFKGEVRYTSSISGTDNVILTIEEGQEEAVTNGYPESLTLTSQDGAIAVYPVKKYSHVFTPVGNKESDKLPSYTFTIDRGLNNAFTYSGIVLDSVSFNAAAEDRLKLDVTCIGKEEATGTAEEIATVSERSFKFHQGKVLLDNAKIADVTSIGFEYKNNCESFQSTDTGYYFSQPVQGKRECTATLETLYTNTIEDLRNQKFKTDAVVQIIISFKDDNNNELVFTIPNAQIQSMENPTATGAETLKQSITVQAVDLGGDFVKVELKNDVAEEY